MMRRFTEAGITLEPRSIGSCLDLAFRFSCRYLAIFLGLWLSVAGPAMLMTYVVATSSSFGWLAAILTAGLMSPFLAGLLLTHAISIAFCEPLTVSGIYYRAWWMNLKTLLARIGLRCVQLVLLVTIIPPFLFLIYTGFQWESRLLKGIRKRMHDHRTQDLVQQEFSDLSLRAGACVVCGLILWFVLTMTLDGLCMLLFGVSPVFGVLAEAADDPWGYLDFGTLLLNMATALVTHPLLLSTLVGTFLMTYAWLRLAWFFTYIDLRIREDCWDLELALADEARRWGPVT
ncbi:hypothetical protein GC163_24650 [bacterium]|nr:hypothetical protein [bacterium]